MSRLYAYVRVFSVHDPTSIVVINTFEIRPLMSLQVFNA